MQPSQRPRFRLLSFSLRQLMLATAFVAVGCYALRWASPFWSIAIFNVALAIVVGGLLVAINRPGATRSFWLGFAVCAVAHWLVASGDIRAVPYGAAFTNRISAAAYRQLKPQLAVDPIRVSLDQLDSHHGHGATVLLADGTTIEFKACEDGCFRSTGPGSFYVAEGDFVDVSRGLWTLLLAYLGGHVSLAIYRTRPAHQPEA